MPQHRVDCNSVSGASFSGNLVLELWPSFFGDVDISEATNVLRLRRQWLRKHHMRRSTCVPALSGITRQTFQPAKSVGLNEIKSVETLEARPSGRRPRGVASANASRDRNLRTTCRGRQYILHLFLLSTMSWPAVFELMVFPGIQCVRIRPA